MAKRVSLSGRHLPLDAILVHFKDVEASLRGYYNNPDPIRFIGYTSEELQIELQQRLAEADLSSSLNALAALEATFRVDYLQRSYMRKRDKLSKLFRQIYIKQGARASFEDDILKAWRESTSGNDGIIGDIRGAFKYRHWLAHGRYWEPKLGRKYDFATIYGLSVDVTKIFGFDQAEVKY
jgi:hypothetical protein